MPILEQLIRRFKELERELQSLPFEANEFSGEKCYDTARWQQWATSSQNLLGAAFGEKSPHYRNFQKHYAACGGYEDQFSALKGIFLAAMSDYEGGYAFNLETVVTGEVFGDFVSMAKLALSEHQKDVAAVLASAALEDTLKRYAIRHGLDVESKVLQDVVNALKSKGLVKGTQKSLLDSMVKVRDYSMHANWEKVQDADVSSVIGYVEQFLLSHFS